MSMIPNKLKKELTDVGKVYNNGSCIVSHPDSFDRLQTEIIKVCNEKDIAEKQVIEAKDVIKYLLKYIFTPQGFEQLDKKIIEKAEQFIKE